MGPLAYRAYGFYDSRNSRNDQSYSQFTLGTEFLTRNVSVLLNGYFADEECNQLSSSGQALVKSGKLFVGNLTECSSSGFDFGGKYRFALGETQNHLIELGAKYFTFSNDTFAEDLNGYTLGANYAFLNAFGFNRSKLNLGFSYSDDSNDLRNDGDPVFSVVAGVQIPLGRLFRKKVDPYRFDVKHIMEHTKIDRDIDVVTPSDMVISEAKDPNGNSINAFFVNEAGGGTGQAEGSPITLADFATQADAYDVAFFVSNGNDIDVNSATGFNLLEGQQFVGVVDRTGQVRYNSSWLSLTTAGSYSRQTITNSDTSALSDYRVLNVSNANNVFSGLSVNVASTAAATGGALLGNWNTNNDQSVGNVYIHNNILNIESSATDAPSAVYFEQNNGAVGNFFITNNTITGTNTSSSSDAINLTQSNSSSAGDMGTVLISNNSISGEMNGISLAYEEGPSVLNWKIQNNTVALDDGLGMSITITDNVNASSMLEISSNTVTVSGTNDSGLELEVGDSNLTPATLSAVIEGNTINAGSGNGVNITGSVNTNFTISNNMLTGTDNEALRVNAGENTDFTITNNTLNLVDTLSFSDDSAVQFLISNGVNSTIIFTGNTVTSDTTDADTASAAVRIFSNSGTTNNVKLQIEDNTISTDGTYAFVAQAPSSVNTNFCLKTGGNTFTGDVYYEDRSSNNGFTVEGLGSPGTFVSGTETNDGTNPATAGTCF